jgi:hypothetical protein
MNAAGGVVGSNVGSTIVTSDPVAWTAIPEFVYTAPATTAYVSVQIGINGSAPRVIGDTLDFRRILLTVNATPTTYFDGDTPAGGGYTYAWTGTAKASSSQRWRQDVGP